MAMSQQLITQVLALSVGFLMIFICFFLDNGEYLYPKTNAIGYITYTSKFIVEYQGQRSEGNLDCADLESQGGKLYRECLIFETTFSLAIISMVFGGLSLLIITLRLQDCVKMLFQKCKVLKIFVLIPLFVPVFIEILMPMWKIINGGDSLFTYKIGPVILEFISFIAFSLAFIAEVLQGNKQSQTGLLS